MIFQNIKPTSDPQLNSNHTLIRQHIETIGEIVNIYGCAYRTMFFSTLLFQILRQDRFTQ